MTINFSPADTKPPAPAALRPRRREDERRYFHDAAAAAAAAAITAAAAAAAAATKGKRQALCRYRGQVTAMPVAHIDNQMMKIIIII